MTATGQKDGTTTAAASGDLTTGDPGAERAAHTPTPWRALPPAQWCGTDDWIIPGVAHCGNGELSEGNAKFIVRACNVHDDMLAVCNAARRVLKSRDQTPEEAALLIALAAVTALAEGRS